MDQRTSPGIINVVIVDDHPVIGAGLQTLLHSFTDIAVAGVAQSAREATELLERISDRVQIVLADVNLPDTSGVIFTRTVCKRWPDCQVLLFTGYPQFAHAGIKAGARGYLLKDSSPEELAAAIRNVAHGSVYLHKDIQRDLVNTLQQIPTVLSQFSEHEIRVLGEMARGATNLMIAQQTGFSEATMKMQVSAIYQKLGVRNRAEAIHVALQLGLLEAVPPSV